MKKRIISMVSVLMLLCSIVCVPVGATLAVPEWGAALPVNTKVDPDENKFYPAEQNANGGWDGFSILDTDADGNLFILAGNHYGQASRGPAVFNPSDSTSIAYYLNTTLYNGNADKKLNDGIKANLIEYDWPTNGGTRADYTWKGKLAILSYDEYLKYYTKFGPKTGGADSWWHLRSVGSNDQVRGVSAGNTADVTIGSDDLSSVRPCFWLSRDYFKTNKINLSLSGTDVISLLKTNYTRNELATAGYTNTELASLFPSVLETITAVSISGVAKPGKTLKATVTTQSGNVGSYNYEWQSADTEDGTYTTVSTNELFVVPNSMAEKYIRVSVASFSDEATSEAVTSAPVLVGKALAAAEYGKALPNNNADPTGNKFYVDGKTATDNDNGFSILDTDADGNLFILAGNQYGKFAGRGPNVINPADSTSVGYYLNTTLYNGGADRKLEDGIKENLIEADWPTNGGSENDYEWKGKLSLLSYDEYFKYADKFGAKIGGVESWWAIRSVGPVGQQRGVNTGVGQIYVWQEGIRPCFWLSKDYFKENRISLTYSGEDVFRTIRTLIPRSEMAATEIYSDEELNQIYSSSETAAATDVKLNGVAAVGQTLTGSYTYQSSSGAAESGTVYAWYRSADGTSWEKISNATGLSYTITEADNGKMLRFGVTVKNAEGVPCDEVFSPATVAVSTKKDITVTFKELRDASGNTVTAANLKDKTALTAVFTIENITTDNKTVSLVLAYYTGTNQMKNCALEKTVTVTPGTKEYTVSLTGITVLSGYRVRAMALSDMTNIIPLCGYEITAQ